MEELVLNDQIVLFDRDATTSAYKTIKQLGTDICPCAACRNFRHFRQVAYGPRLLALLMKLGIDPMKEWEVYSAGVEVNNNLEYGGWFPFVGEWSSNKSNKDVFGFPKQEEFFFFTDSFPNATEKFGKQVLAVEFTVYTPKAHDYVSDWA